MTHKVVVVSSVAWRNVSNTVTFVSGTLPQFVTIPLKLTVPPTAFTVGGVQFLVTAMHGFTHTVQTAVFVAETVFETNPCAALKSVPEATTVFVNGPQRFP